MPFKEGMLFWPLLGKEANGLFLEPATLGTLIGPKTKREFKERANTYPICGPLGSPGTKIPSNVAELHRVRNDEASQMSEDWEKGTWRSGTGR